MSSHTVGSRTWKGARGGRGERRRGPEPRRPELLSRIGDNIVVFDFISPAVGRDLVAKYLAAVARRVQSRYGVTLRISDGVADVVSTHALDNLRFGGGGIGSAVETVFVNPLTRVLVDRSLRRQS